MYFFVTALIAQLFINSQGFILHLNDIELKKNFRWRNNFWCIILKEKEEKGVFQTIEYSLFL